MSLDDFNFSNDDEFIREMTDLVKKFGKRAYDYLVQIQEAGGWKKFVNTAWYGDEKETDIFTLKECIEWVKAYYDKEKHSGAFVGKKQAEDRLLLKVCFADKDGKPFSDEESHYLIVRCNNLDESFKNQFGDKSTIIIK